MKRKLKKRIIIPVFIIIIGLVISIIMIIIKNNKDINKVILGTWTTPGGTLYTFNKNNEGIMHVPLNDYKFTYKIEENVISIDFEEDTAFDPTYEYSLENSKLILSGVNGTFIFRKVKVK